MIDDILGSVIYTIGDVNICSSLRSVRRVYGCCSGEAYLKLSRRRLELADRSLIDRTEH